MGIALASQFDVNAALPLDSRMQVVDNTARDAIVSGRRWEGMIVYSVGAAKAYQLVGGVTNSDWVEVGSGSGAATTGPFTVTNNSNSNLASETTDHTLFTQVDFVARVIRGTTVFSKVDFSIFYINGAWALVLGPERPSGVDAGMTWTVDASTGQINAAADNGAGNATITLKKTQWAI